VSGGDDEIRGGDDRDLRFDDLNGFGRSAVELFRDVEHAGLAGDIGMMDRTVGQEAVRRQHDCSLSLWRVSLAVSLTILVEMKS
jgi:hypothetical protein